MIVPAQPAEPEPFAELDAYQRAESPLHRSRPCPTCGRESHAIIAGRCLRCRSESA